ncbi:MAG: superinfection immunity protein [Candidatus Sedimenticola sp. (ex Thyasira tokunagai)]
MENTDVMNQLMAYLFTFLLLCLYMTPSLIGAARKHHRSNAICWVNFLLGWTVIGWVGALIWAVAAVDHEQS